jgi:hypothetical protein
VENGFPGRKNGGKTITSNAPNQRLHIQIYKEDSMKAITFAVGLVLLLVAVPVQAQMVTSIQRADIEKAVNELILQMLRSYETNDVEKFFQYFNREQFVGYVAGGTIGSLEQMKQQWTKDWATRTAQNRIAKEVRVRVLSPEAALAVWSGTGMNALKNGNVANFTSAGIALCTKEPSGWKITSFASGSTALQ